MAHKQERTQVMKRLEKVGANLFPEMYAEINKVVDGDTFHFIIQNEEFVLRLMDIDAPEKEEEKGQRTIEYVKEQLENKEVKIIFGEKIKLGKWGRVLGHIMYMGMDFGETLVRLGYAEPFEQRNQEEIKLPKEMLEWL